MEFLVKWKVHIFVVISMFIFLCEFSVISKYDEMNCNFFLMYFEV